MPQSEVDQKKDSAPARILLVEDEPLIRFTMAEALRDCGVCVVEAATGDEAWQYLTSGGSVDLVFTDHRMPGVLTGAELATRIRRHFPRLAVVVASAYLEDRLWPGPFISKPYNLLKTAAELAGRAAGRGQIEGDP